MQKSADAASPDTTAPRTRLSGKLGVGAIVFMVMAAAAPLAVVAGGAPLAVAFGNGSGAAGDFLIVAIVMFFFTVALAAMSRFVGNSGVFYVYVGRGLSPVVGVMSAFVSWMLYTVMQAGIYAFMGTQMNTLLSVFGVDSPVPWWAWSLIGIALVGVLGYREIDLSSRVLGIILILEIAVVLYTCIAVLLQLEPAQINFNGFTPSVIFSSLPAFALGIMFTASGFIGFESTAIYRDEAKDPDRTVPRATYIAVIVVGVFYSFSIWAIDLAWGDAHIEAAASGSGFALDIAAAYAGGFVQGSMSVLIVTSFFACALSLHNVITRYQFNLSNTGLAPRSLSQISGRTASPSNSSLTQTITAGAIIAVTAVLGMDPMLQVFGWGAGIATIAFFGMLTLTSIAVFFFFRRDSRDKRVWNTIVAPILAALGLGSCTVITFWNFPDLIGDSPAISYSLLGLIVAFAVAGLATGLWHRQKKTTTYDRVVALISEE